MPYVDKKWCGRKCGDAPTYDQADPWNMEDSLNCPSGYDWWTKGKYNSIYGRSDGGWKRLRWGTGSYWMKRCVRQIPGDKMDCALGKYDANQCPNDYAKNQPRSIEFMRKYCHGDRIVTNSNCARWGDINKKEYDIKLKNFCNSVSSIENHKKCRTFCFENPGKCDIINNRSGGYCSLHKDDALCGCINSPLNDFPGGSKGRPPATCFDNTCMSAGYKPDANARGVRRSNVNECGDFMDCSQSINISDKAFLDRVKISQVCLIEKKQEAKEKADKAAAEAAAIAEKNRESILAATLAKEARFKAEKARRELEKEREKYLAETPTWKIKYDSVVSSGPLKNISDNINNIIPDTNLKVGGVELDSVKPLLVLLFVIVVLIAMEYQSQQQPQYQSQQQSQYQPRYQPPY